MFGPVAYINEKEVHETFSTVIGNINANEDFLRTLDRQLVVANIFQMLLFGVTCLKHEGFKEEREWRAIYVPKFAASPLMISSTEIIGGVPQIIYQIPLDKSASSALAELDLISLFDRLVIGPSPYPWAMYDAFVDVLAKEGVADAVNRVCVSGIPLRV
jgi:hypothetical protein